MNRRGFLKMLGLAGPAAIVAPKYFFAPVGGWHSDVIANPIALQLERIKATLPELYSVPFTWDEAVLQSVHRAANRVSSRPMRVPFAIGSGPAHPAMAKHSISREWIALA